jgi:hypothetical protein
MTAIIAFLAVAGIFAIAFLLAFCKCKKRQSKMCQQAWKERLTDSIEKAKPNWDKIENVDKFMEDIR